MPKEVYTLVDDIYGLLTHRGNVPHKVNEENLDYYLATVKSLLLKYLEGPREPEGGGKPSLRISKIGTKPRRLWYEWNTPGYTDEGHSGPNILKFLVGSLIEPLLLFMAKETGHVVTHEQAEVSLDGVPGHPDAVIDGCLVDVKTASPFGFEKFSQGRIFSEDDFGYLPQLAGYKEALGLPEETPSLFLALEKSKCELALLEVPLHFLPNASRLIADAREVVKQDYPPEELCWQPKPHGKSGNMELANPCSWCPFKFKCFPHLRAFQYAKGVTFLSRVEKLPDVPEITHHFN